MGWDGMGWDGAVGGMGWGGMRRDGVGLVGMRRDAAGSLSAKGLAVTSLGSKEVPHEHQSLILTLTLILREFTITWSMDTCMDA